MLHRRDPQEGLGIDGRDNIRMDIKEIGINTRNGVDSAQIKDYWKALVNMALHFQVP